MLSPASPTVNEGGVPSVGTAMARVAPSRPTPPGVGPPARSTEAASEMVPAAVPTTKPASAPPTLTSGTCTVAARAGSATVAVRAPEAKHRAIPVVGLGDDQVQAAGRR